MILMSCIVYIKKKKKKIMFLIFFIAAMFSQVLKKAENFKDVVKIWVGPKLVICLIDPRDVEIILSSNVYIDKSTEYRFFKPWLGDGLLISTGKF